MIVIGFLLRVRRLHEPAQSKSAIKIHLELPKFAGCSWNAIDGKSSSPIVVDWHPWLIAKLLYAYRS
jgi:hypothetical protein